MKILVKFPSRERPKQFRRAIDLYWGLADNINNIDFLISLDEDDKELINYDITEADNCKIVIGKSESKIHACNRDIGTYKKDWDIICLASDDMIPQVKGWDSVIIAAMETYFPDTDGYLHFDDSHQHGNCSTFTIMGRKYYDRFNYLYYPKYRNLWSDVEQTEVAWMLGKYQYMGDNNVIIKHDHPMFNKMIGWDNQYALQSSQTSWDYDHAIIMERRAINYGLNKKQIINGFKYPKL